MNSNFSDLRREYIYSSMNESELDPDPIRQFAAWFQKAVDAGLDLPNAMALATASRAGAPSVRYVLMKGFDANGLVFYSHSGSVKGRQLTDNPHAALVFYWAPMHRQVRIDGTVETVSAQEADEYFQSRPYDSRVSAWVSKQSTVVPSREFLEQEFYRVAEEFPGEEIPRPQDWVGYRIVPTRFEFWQGREGRLHDRIEYMKNNGGAWTMHRLAP